jgi:hypothetical protein
MAASPAKRTPAKKTAAPAKSDPTAVDETVVNQESPGSQEPVDRSPGQNLVTDDAGVTYDMNKTPAPEIVDLEAEERAQEKARIRQNEAALNAKDWQDEDKKDDSNTVELEFVETGLTHLGHVWKKGEILRCEESELEDWMKYSAEEQKQRYKRVYFEKR